MGHSFAFLKNYNIIVAGRQSQTARSQKKETKKHKKPCLFLDDLIE